MFSGILVLAHLMLCQAHHMHLIVNSPVLVCLFGVEIFSNWHNPHIDFLTFGVMAIIMGKAKWKPLELLIPRKIANQK